jgi:hypothetical protein
LVDTVTRSQPVMGLSNLMLRTYSSLLSVRSGRAQECSPVAQAKATAAQVQRQILEMIMSNSSMRLPVFMPIIVGDSAKGSSHDRLASFASMKRRSKRSKVLGPSADSI